MEKGGEKKNETVLKVKSVKRTKTNKSLRMTEPLEHGLCGGGNGVRWNGRRKNMYIIKYVIFILQRN